MSAGSVLYMTGKRKCSELGGLIQSMPITAVCGIIGALSISAFPLTSGFVSKSMISQASVDEHLLWVWLLLQAASAGVFLHAGIKFPWFVFFQAEDGIRDQPRSRGLGDVYKRQHLHTLLLNQFQLSVSYTHLTLPTSDLV